MVAIENIGKTVCINDSEGSQVIFTCEDEDNAEVLATLLSRDVYQYSIHQVV